MTLRFGTRALMAVAMVCVTSCQSPEPGSEHVAAGDTVDSAMVVQPGPAQVDTSLTPDGWGAIRIGMTLDELTAVAGADANPQAVGGPDPERCDEFRPTEAPDAMLVMIERGRLTRISISEGSDVTTERGFGVGDTAADIKSAYGADASSEPHRYAPAPAEYITIWQTPPPAPEARGILYDIGADGRVVHVRAGGPSIQYYEGCV